jgi:RNA polymerase sigma-70 factor (ECF subfamily)
VAYNPVHDERLIAEQMLAALPPKYRIPLLMKEMDNFSFEEIALMMKKPVGTIKSLVFRAKEFLQGMALAEKGEQDGISQ